MVTKWEARGEDNHDEVSDNLLKIGPFNVWVYKDPSSISRWSMACERLGFEGISIPKGDLNFAKRYAVSKVEGILRAALLEVEDAKK